MLKSLLPLFSDGSDCIMTGIRKVIKTKSIHTSFQLCYAHDAQMGMFAGTTKFLGWQKWSICAIDKKKEKPITIVTRLLGRALQQPVQQVHYYFINI